MTTETRTNITGPPHTWPQGASPPVRREINDLIADERQFSLYIQALARMADTSQTKSISHYQIGGIHGLPFTRWEDAGPQNSVGQWEGYCTHGSVLFPTWHRPYVSLYEQILQQHAVDIAKTLPAEWQKSAQDLRQPYWDWAINAVPPPEVIDLQNVDILQPDGSKKSVSNPLYHYRFNPIDPSFGEPYINWPTTMRQPTSEDSTAKDNTDLLKQQARAEQNSITRAVFNLFARIRTWSAFSNHTIGDGGAGSSSLEGIHDNIHDLVGGAGHMGDPGVAAFDPIFFLHHCNVDRLLALWQAINSNVWVTRDRSQQGGTWTMGANQTIDATTQLAPFWNGDLSGLYWTSNQARDYKTLGYTYPEFIGIESNDPATIRFAIGQKIFELYSGNTVGSLAAAGGALRGALRTNLAAFGGASTAASTDADAGAKQAALQAPANNPGSSAAGDSVQVASNPISNPAYYEWSARVQIEKYALGCSFNVCIFLFSPGEDKSSVSDSNSNDWYASPHYVGQFSAFVNTIGRERCANCQGQAAAKLVIEGFVSLTDALVNKGLDTTNFDEVHKYLEHNLVWKVRKVNGEVVPLVSVPSLEVSVFSSAVASDPGDDGVFPGYDPAQQHRKITLGKAGGCREGHNVPRAD